MLKLFSILSAIYVFPIIHADYPYIDDQWRSLQLVDGAWIDVGRYFTERLYNLLTFSGSMPNIFPLPLLLSLMALCATMSNLAFYLYRDVDIAKCIVILPLLCSPFFWAT